MSKTKIAITLDVNRLRRLDYLVETQVFENRSRAVEAAVAEKLARLERSGLARECAKLDPEYEQALAEAGLSAEANGWPEYRGANRFG